ncbi:uncharacterized protein LOC113161747 [Anabas testudineus]|uniref:uncharacterized protein LOC113161747 n=1 Tax=Anabas testudineus TaxID=64144 RepID=UPI000E4651BB|nr:uncharacterized protein LOC113161747 [Anabas testudineus]
MLKVWRIQRVHILRGCLSDPEVLGGILYRHGGTVQLNHVPGEGAKVPVWIPIRGTSQQEGYHFHQAQWVTGTRVSPELFQAQGMTGVARWNYQRLVDLKLPGVCLPAAFDPALIADLNAASERVLGQVKYPVLHLSATDTGEKFGLGYVEPGSRPIPLDWDKHRTKTGSTHNPPPPQDSSTVTRSELLQASSVASAKLFQFPACPPADAADETPTPVFEPKTEPGSTYPPPLPLLSTPTAARTGPVKTGGRVFVLDHKRWPAPMKKTIDDLLIKYHGQKDMLKLVDQDYAALVHNSCRDPNSMLHPTTKLHISQYVKHLSKLMNTSSSLNTSPEKLQERQQLWHALTVGSETTSVPVVTMPVPVVNPPPPVQPLATPLTPDSIEKIQGPVRYFYCSTKVFKAYGGEGLTNPKMPFEDFTKSQFFQRELDATKKKVEERDKQKRKRTESQPTGRKCRFCKTELKQGPNSRHIHTGFSGIAGKYIYCPAKVFSLYRDQGMEREMTWKEFQETPFYDKERQRWMGEKRK